ncbi:MAG: hypothetical protein OEO84_05550 [Betaproteobacteria bacterium]|nr:hypothetical protein [Betaproteobacteria bacterium]
MRTWLAAMLLVLGAPAWAAPFAVRLGGERMVLDAPPGFADTLELASPRLRELAESLTSASNRILLFALTDADLRLFSGGDSPALHRYLLLATPRALERDSVGLSRFRDYATESVRTLGAAAQPADIGAFLSAQPIGRAMLLRELRREPQAVSLLIGTRLPPRFGDTPQYLLFTTTQLLLRGKVLGVSVYSGLDDAADAAWLLDMTQRWTDELQRLNAR